MVIPLNRGTAFVSQEVVLIAEKDDLYRRIEVRVRHTVRDNEASEHCNGIIHIVNVDVTSGGTIGNRHRVGSVSVVLYSHAQKVTKTREQILESRPADPTSQNPLARLITFWARLSVNRITNLSENDEASAG